MTLRRLAPYVFIGTNLMVIAGVALVYTDHPWLGLASVFGAWITVVTYRLARFGGE